MSFFKYIILVDNLIYIADNEKSAFKVDKKAKKKIDK